LPRLVLAFSGYGRATRSVPVSMRFALIRPSRPLLFLLSLPLWAPYAPPPRTANMSILRWFL
jgi:hypothetical protein